MAIVLWSLSKGRFPAAALGWGRKADRLTLAVAGDPRVSSLVLDALLRFARWFNAEFEEPASHVELDDREDLPTCPQIVVPNEETVEQLGRIGRYLAQQPLEGANAVDPSLIRLGRHLLFLKRWYGYPGQQIVLPMTDLLQTHWSIPADTTSLSEMYALTVADEVPDIIVGPNCPAEGDEAVKVLIDRMNNERGGRTAPRVLSDLLHEITAHYRPMTERVWRLLWACRQREAQIEEAPSTSRRWTEDCRAYRGHMQRMRKMPRHGSIADRGTDEDEEGRKRRASSMLMAEEACDDPLRMQPYLDEGRAVRGRVVSLEVSEAVEGNRLKRPLLLLETSDPCRLAPGTKVYWTMQPRIEWVLEQIVPAESGWRVELRLNAAGVRVLPAPDSIECFSVLTTSWVANSSPMAVSMPAGSEA